MAEDFPVNTDREMLIRMEGNIQRVLDRMDTQQSMTQALDQRVQGHSVRFQTLEGRLSAHDVVFAGMTGERKGVQGTVRVAWVVISVLITAVVTLGAAILARHLGV